MPPIKGKAYGTLGELKADATERRDTIEEGIAICLATSQDMAEIALRIEQAVRRAAVVSPVLLPALDRVSQVRERMQNLHTSLAQYWKENAAHRWA